MQAQYDAIILGAGMVGLVAANLCAQQNFRIALVDRQLPRPWDPNQRDIRCSAISRGSQNVLRSLGVWDKIAGSRISAYQRMEVWDALSEGEIRFDASDIDEADLGHIIENSLIIHLLWEKLLEAENVDRFLPTTPINFNRQADHIILQLNDEQTLSAKLLMGADGAQSWLRQAADIETRGWEYQQNALIATVETEMKHQAVARQCFLKDGILAFLPLDDPHLSSIVWSTGKEQSNLLLELNEKEFCEELAHAFDYRLGKVTHVGERRSFPLGRQHAEQYIDERIALIGDAAHVIHPLAGQGVNLGIYDADLLIGVLKQFRDRGYDLGHTLILRRYERARKGHNLAMMAGIEFFKRIFSQDASILQGIRGLGMNRLNASKFLKQQLIKQAMGYR